MWRNRKNGKNEKRLQDAPSRRQLRNLSAYGRNRRRNGKNKSDDQCCRCSDVTEQLGDVTCRQQETEKLKELDMMRKVKGLQLIYAKRLKHRELLLHFLSTSTHPAIYWLPAKHSTTTQAMMDSHASDHASWRVWPLLPGFLMGDRCRWPGDPAAELREGEAADRERRTTRGCRIGSARRQIDHPRRGEGGSVRSGRWESKGPSVP